MNNYLYLLLLFFVAFSSGCKDKRRSVDFHSLIIDSDKGISPDTLDFIYGGPKGFTLEYFPREVIQLARISNCKIISIDTPANRVVRNISFDAKGNIINEDYNYFPYWFEGTVAGNYSYYYDSSNNLLKIVGKPRNVDTDSIMTIDNYTSNGLLHSRDRYEFGQKLKPGADKHLPGTDDYEKYPTWHMIDSHRFSHESNEVVIEKISDGRVFEKVRYVLQFDSLGRLSATTKYTDDAYNEVTRYNYELYFISGRLHRKRTEGRDFNYHSRSVLTPTKNQAEKIVFNEDGTERVRMVTTYNQDGTIRSINYDSSIQTFEYTYRPPGAN
jgi:hypothetical protein